MKSYNGFSPDQRNKAQGWLNAQWRAGTLPRPVKCMACGQEHGRIDAHAEDYSEPFAAGKTDQYHLCFRCHMMVHCRFRNPESWARYKSEVAKGTTFSPVPGNSFGVFAKQHLDAWAPILDHTGQPRPFGVLDLIG